MLTDWRSAYHTEAIAHRARVQNQIANLLAELGDRWDRDKPGEVARLYSSNGTIVLGPLNSIQGRDEIRKALTGSRRMRARKPPSDAWHPERLCIRKGPPWIRRALLFSGDCSPLYLTLKSLDPAETPSSITSTL
ncbi:MAG: nuclear transport factor 2 family protein [Gemmatimonadaceae bacterium]